MKGSVKNIRPFRFFSPIEHDLALELNAGSSRDIKQTKGTLYHPSRTVVQHPSNVGTTFISKQITIQTVGPYIQKDEQLSCRISSSSYSHLLCPHIQSYLLEGYGNIHVISGSWRISLRANVQTA